MDGREARATGCPVSRRNFLQALGLGAVTSAVTIAPGLVRAAQAGVPADWSGAGSDHTPRPGTYRTTFGRMFELPPFAPASDALTAALLDLGRPGGPLDAGDDLAAGPAALITDPALRINNPDNHAHTAGTTFVGQFVDHDITFDAGSPLGVPTDVQDSSNLRTPMLDLDSLYGSGPVGSPHLYSRSDPAKLRYESGGRFEDVPRAADMTPIIADPRNDEHLILSGLHCAVLRFHNRVVDHIRRNRASPPDFEVARRLTTWHYQWIVVNEFLPQVVGPGVVEDILRRGRRVYRPPDGAFIPVEFQGAAYRFGHSMVRPSYRANLAGNDDGGPFFGFIFDSTAPPSPDPDDLVGGFRAPRRFVGWQTFFDFGDGEVKPNKLIDTTLSTPLFALPRSAITTGDAPTVLPQRTLLRHVTWSLPSGQAIAEHCGAPRLGPADFPELAVYDLGLESSSPLWYYVLKEAELVEGGARLGPVGARIVAEVLLGLLQLDRDSYLNAPPGPPGPATTRGDTGWRPTLPTRSGVVSGEFSMVDLLTFAGVDPASRGQ